MSTTLKTYLPICCLAAFLAPAAVHANMVPILNPGFEAPVLSTIVSVPDGWVTYGGNSYNPYEFFGGADKWYVGANPGSDPALGNSGYAGIGGENLAYVYQPNGTASGFYQTLSSTLLANSIYTLSISVGARNGSYEPNVFAGSTLELLAGNTVIASATEIVGPIPGTFELQTATVNSSILNQTLIGQQLTVRFESTNNIGYGATDWDNISLQSTAATPEPAFYGLMALGLTGLAFVRKSKKSQNN